MTTDKRVFHPTIFRQFANVAAVLSLRDPEAPDQFSMLHGARRQQLEHNRAKLALEAGFEPGQLVFPHLEHDNRVVVLDESPAAGDRPAGDAVVTNLRSWLIGVTIADCVAVLLYDPEHQAVGVIHSGWRGSAKNVAAATVRAMQEHYTTNPGQLYTYISPAPAREEYEVGAGDVASQFDAKYSTPKAGGKAWFDNKAVVYDQLQAAGVKPERIELDPRSTIADPQLHSFRRNGASAGRSLAAIGLHSS